MLSGAAGQFFGNNPIWHFDGPTLFPFTGDWRQALDAAGSRDMSHLAAFFRARPGVPPVPGGRRHAPDRGGNGRVCYQRGD